MRKKALAGEDYDERLLADVFSRGGFTDGYLKRRTGAEMFGTRTAEDAKTAAAAYPAIHELYRREYKRARLDIAAEVRRGKPLHITATDENGLQAEFIGKVPEQARNKPCDEAFLRKQLGKLGDTYFELGDMHCKIDDGLAVAAGELNAARRELCEKTQRPARGAFFSPRGFYAGYPEARTARARFWRAEAARKRL